MKFKHFITSNRQHRPYIYILIKMQTKILQFKALYQPMKTESRNCPLDSTNITGLNDTQQM